MVEGIGSTPALLIDPPVSPEGPAKAKNIIIQIHTTWPFHDSLACDFHVFYAMKDTMALCNDKRSLIRDKQLFLGLHYQRPNAYL